MRKYLSLLVAIVIVGAFITAAKAETWNMASTYPESTFHTKNIRLFINDVEKATNGKLKIILHSGSSLFSMGAMKQAVQTGQVPIGEVLLGQYGNEHPIFEASAIPFLATGLENAKKLWEITLPIMTEYLAKQGTKLLYGVPWPEQGIYTKKPITRCADLKGLKFRVYSPMTARLAEQMGAIPTQIQFSEIPQAFATGTVHAMYTSAQSGADTQAWDFTSHFTNVVGNHVYNGVIVNEKAFKRLNSELQKSLLEAAAKAGPRGLKMCYEATSSNLKILKDHGMIISTPGPEFMAELNKIGETLTAEWIKKAGSMGEEAIKKFRQ
jgi:TRAP-type C4-dicarboxylate transport system substrate-binding protein